MGSWGTNYAANIPDAWLRLIRVGNNFRGYRSSDGTNWTLVSATTQALNTSQLVGLGVCSRVSSILSTGLFTNFELTRPAQPKIINPVFDGMTQQFMGSVETLAGLNYVVQYRDTLPGALWLNLTTLTGDGTVKTFTDPGPALPATRFYRLQVQ
jgi:hypothetical protein